MTYLNFNFGESGKVRIDDDQKQLILTAIKAFDKHYSDHYELSLGRKIEKNQMMDHNDFDDIQRCLGYLWSKQTNHDAKRLSAKLSLCMEE